MVEKLYPAWNPNAKFAVISGADHFYGGYQDKLEAVLADFLERPATRNTQPATRNT
jgi:alpha/beta superfamily hydrolase